MTIMYFILFAFGVMHLILNIILKNYDEHINEHLIMYSTGNHTYKIQMVVINIIAMTIFGLTLHIHSSFLAAYIILQIINYNSLFIFNHKAYEFIKNNKKAARFIINNTAYEFYDAYKKGVPSVSISNTLNSMANGVNKIENGIIAKLKQMLEMEKEDKENDENGKCNCDNCGDHPNP